MVFIELYAEPPLGKSRRGKLELEAMQYILSSLQIQNKEHPSQTKRLYHFIRYPLKWSIAYWTISTKRHFSYRCAMSVNVSILLLAHIIDTK